MKKLLTLLILILVSISLYSQEKIILNHTLKIYDIIEVSLEIENKPNDNFHLIKIDTLIIKDNKGEMHQDNFIKNIFRKANVLARYEIDEKKKYKYFDIKGVIKYFKPSESQHSYFNLGQIKNLKKNINLIDKSITQKNPNIFFSIVDSITVEKVFPNFEYRTNDYEEIKKLDFKSYDLMYACKSDKKQDFVIAVNKDIDPGYNTLTLTDKNTGIKYKLIKLKQEMTISEKEKINIELMIENENSVELIPFDFKNVKPRDL